MKKNVTVEKAFCDFCEEEVEAVGVCKPTNKDVCKFHYNEFLSVVDMIDEEEEGIYRNTICLDPGYKKAKIKVKFVEK